MTISQIIVTELANYLTPKNSDLSAPFQPKISAQLVDVREPAELAIAKIDGFINLPLSQFESWSGQIHDLLDSKTETLVLCHHGVRSMQMCQWLAQQGFSDVKNIAHGIDAYSRLVDDTIPFY